MGRPRFELGQIVATPGALELIARSKADPLTLISRHVRGDWGNVHPEDAAANERALKEGTRLLSSYQVGGQKLWIITEANRSVTTLLLPEEY